MTVTFGCRRSVRLTLCRTAYVQGYQRSQELGGSAISIIASAPCPLETGLRSISKWG